MHDSLAIAGFLLNWTKFMLCVCVHLLVKVFAKPPDEQEPEIFFISMMYLVIAVGCGIATFLTVRNAQY